MKLLRLGWAGAFIFAALVYPVAWIISGTAVEAWQITPFDESMVQVNKVLFELEELDSSVADYPTHVMKIYGHATEEPIRWLFVSEERFLRPTELPSLTLLPVDKQRGEDPFQEQTLFFFAKRFAAGAAVTGILLLGLWLLLRRRRRRKPPPPEPVSS